MAAWRFIWATFRHKAEFHRKLVVGQSQSTSHLSEEVRSLPYQVFHITAFNNEKILFKKEITGTSKNIRVTKEKVFFDWVLSSNEKKKKQSLAEISQAVEV